MPTALLSVSDKTGLDRFARALAGRGWSLVSTGGTAEALRGADLEVREVGELTGHPEILGGRVKTLHPAVHAGILARTENSSDGGEMEEHGYGEISLVAVNLYPFREAVARAEISLPEAVERIDVGGPAMLRAAAKNHQRVWAVADPADYDEVLSSLDTPAQEQHVLRLRLARKAFAHTSAYDAAISAFFGQKAGQQGGDHLPETLNLLLSKRLDLRYGENPGQRAAWYGHGGSGVRQIHGRELSYNNLLDLDAGLLAVSAWTDEAACAVIKHASPCGVAVGSQAAEAFGLAWEADSSSAFGSVVALNREVDTGLAGMIAPNFVEAVAAPSFAPGALEVLRRKKNLRLVEYGAGNPSQRLSSTLFGVLVQDPSPAPSTSGWRTVTQREPSARELADLEFGWRAVASVKSNAVLLARRGQAIGIGGGLASRVDASKLAVSKARENGFDLGGTVLASDGFFPFRDGVDIAAEQGVSAIVQPGGSKRDPEVVRAADEHGVAMVFTGQRLFRH
ncbi:MAG: bifunctional phosphoribosylaminoimidazolecarboxamide formyltransferase/IMP cyclohydrolase [Longimicrobiaceae bacterium]